MQALLCPGGGEPSVTGFGVLVMLVGACSLTSGVFRLIDYIEGR